VRVAALYDVHGNVRALEAVLADVGEVDAFVFGGDLIAGAWPRSTLELALSLGERAHFIRGNWERILVEPRDHPLEASPAKPPTPGGQTASPSATPGAGAALLR